MALSKRLLACANYTNGFNKLADIGTDHAQLPIHCVSEGYVYNALAIDNKEGPFVIAYSNVKKAGLDDKIDVVKADGISKIDDNVDVVVISGMGGHLISSIVKNDDRKNVKRFILQPNSDARVVRQTLNELEFSIVDELVIQDQNKYYDIIVFEKGHQELTSFELEFGPVNLKLKPYFFTERLQKEKRGLENFIERITDPGQKMAVNARIKLIEEALS